MSSRPDTKPRAQKMLVGIAAVGAAIIAGIGFVGSYKAVRDLAREQGFGWFSDVFPIGIDAGIVVLLALDMLLTWKMEIARKQAYGLYEDVNDQGIVTVDANRLNEISVIPRKFGERFRRVVRG